jgi:hypothetical protein
MPENSSILNSSKINNRIKDYLLLFINLLFIVFILVMGYCNRFASDDFINFKNIKYSGFWETFRFFYNVWNPRWTSNLFMNWMMLLFNPGDSLFFYYFFLLMAFIISVFRMFRNLLLLYNLKTNNFLLLNYTIIFISGFFLFTFGVDETWFWLCASTVYILPVIATCFGISFIFSPKNNIFTFLFLILSFLIAGGGNEPFALVFITIFILIIISSLKRNKNSLLKISDRKILNRFIFAALLMTISILVNITSPGDARRLTFLPSIDVIHISGAILYSVFHILIHIFLFKLMYIIPYLFLWMHFGSMLARLKITLVFDVVKIVKRVFTGLILFSILCIILSSAMIRGIPPQRTLTVISLLFAMSFAIIGIVSGYRWMTGKIYLICLFYAGSIAFIIIFSVFMMIQIPIANKHAAFYDKRMRGLESATRFNNGEAFPLAPLPPSGWLYRGDITKDTNNNINKDFRDAMGLQFNVYIDSTLTEPPQIEQPDVLIIRH